MAIFDGDTDLMGEYIRELADTMGLRDWTVGIAHDPPDADLECNAQVHIPTGRKMAMISFPPTWMDRDPGEFRQTVVHELLHCHFAPLGWTVEHTSPVLGMASYTLHYNAHQNAEEVAIDSIALAWAETLPLPIKADQRVAVAANGHSEVNVYVEDRNER